MYSCVPADIIVGMPAGRQEACSRKSPWLPSACSTRFASQIFLYSSVSGASWPFPYGLFGSNRNCWPGMRGVTVFHSPFQLGYFLSCAWAPPSVSISTVANASSSNVLRYNMIVLPSVVGSPRRDARDLHAAEAGYNVRPANGMALRSSRTLLATHISRTKRAKENEDALPKFDQRNRVHRRALRHDGRRL